MKKLLLVTGCIAAGKSTFARILSQRYQIPIFTKDDTKEVLGDTVGFSNREENKKLSLAAVEMMLYVFAQCAPWGADLILEANFSGTELVKLHDIAQKQDYQVLTLSLFGDAELLHERYLHRMRYENRHPAHLSTVIDRLEDFKKIQEYLDSIAIPGNVIRVDATDFGYQKDETLLREIDGFMRE